jgi:hypothetical protein
MMLIILGVAESGLRRSIDNREIGNDSQVRILSSPPKAPHLFLNKCGAFTVLIIRVMLFDAVGVSNESITPLLCVVCGHSSQTKTQQQNYRKPLFYFSFTSCSSWVSLLQNVVLASIIGFRVALIL